MTFYVRATINLQGIRRGEVRSVNPESSWIKENLAAGYLVRVDAGGGPVVEQQAPAPVEVEPVAAEPVAAEDRAPDIAADEGDHADLDETEAVAPQ